MVSGGPWSFNNCLLLIHPLSKGENPEDVIFFCMQISGSRTMIYCPGLLQKAFIMSLGNLLIMIMSKKRNFITRPSGHGPRFYYETNSS